MKRVGTWFAALVFVGLFGLVVGPVGAAEAATATAAPGVPMNVTCINLKSGVERDFSGRSCPRGWARAASPSSNAGVASQKRKNYLASARDLDASLYAVDDDTLFSVGRSTCQILDRGGSFNDVLRPMIQADLDSSVAAAIVVAAVRNLCPGHKQFLTNYLA